MATCNQEENKQPWYRYWNYLCYKTRYLIVNKFPVGYWIFQLLPENVFMPSFTQDQKLSKKCRFTQSRNSQIKVSKTILKGSNLKIREGWAITGYTKVNVFLVWHKPHKFEMDLGRLAIPPQRAQEDIPYHFKIGRPSPFKNGKVVLLWPLRPELDGQDPFQICEACVKLEKRRL
jgi:hypothetical protein